MKCLLFALFVATFVRSSLAQHDTHAGHSMPPDSVRDGSGFLPGIPMSRDGSGTSWLPDTAPMHAYHRDYGMWSVMVHGSAFVRYNKQDMFEKGSRGDSSFDVPNWLMLGVQRMLPAKSQLTFRSMVTAEPISVGGNGYPLLFQTGESYEGLPLVDRQHPHDLFAELALAYGISPSETVSAFAYVAMPGEPALGPPAFMHRPSALHNPNAPLGHHWQDATHIVFGVATLGVRNGIFKLDASLFTGREPNENRYGFDRPRFDSYSVRLSANPTDHLAIQVSRGFLRQPEIVEPETDEVRMTASLLHTSRSANGALWSSAFVWGMNEAQGNDGGGHVHGRRHALLLESDLTLGKQSFYGRAEWVQKSAEDLNVADSNDIDALNIGLLTLGIARDLASVAGLLLTAGVQGSIFEVPTELQPHYGARPISGQIYARLIPAMRMH